jgi:penicillin-binding protein 1A
LNEPPENDGERVEASGPETFRADLLHHRARSLNRVRRGLIAAGVALAMLLVVAGAHAWRHFFGDLPPVPDNVALVEMDRAPGMTFVDATGRVIATRGPKFGRQVRLETLPPYVSLAFLAAEDRRFRKHGAIDWWGTARALVANLRAGHTVEGGSTLTQQLARNLFLGRERTLKRKVQEAVLAETLHRRLGREGVLELYLNRVYLGESAYGVDAAARTYFGKPAAALTLGEAAILAGMPKAPSRLSLARNPKVARARGELILRRMLRENWITPAQQQAARIGSISPLARQPEADLAWVLDMAAAQARAEAGAERSDLVVRLTIDPALQAVAGQALRETLEARGGAAGVRQGAVVLLAPDGAVRALIGGRDHQESPFNRAVQARRQPGSAFKPFVWAAALEKGADALDYVSTDRLAFGPWRPDDPGAKGAKELTVEEALVRSSNGVAVRLAERAGPERVVMLGRRFGVGGLPDRPGLSIALGAYETSLLELTGAYQVFQQEGRFSRPYLVEEVARADGSILYRRPPQPPVVVYDPGRARTMTRMMTGVIERGTGTKAAFGRPAAGKTGTSQDNRDAWFVGYTPDWAAGVWIGNDDGKPMRGVVGGDLPAEVWRRVMIAAHQGLSPRAFGTAGAPVAGGVAGVVFEERSAFYSTLASEFARVAAQ